MEHKAPLELKKPASTATDNSSEGQRILVVDDSPTVIHKVRRVLEPKGFTVLTVNLLIELPQLLKSNPPDLIVLDLHMPALSGLRFANLIRTYQPFEIPIVIYSSRPLQEIKESAEKVGAEGYVQKGGPDHLLIAAINVGLRTSRLARMKAERTV